jgi:hypothetical protein
MFISLICAHRFTNHVCMISVSEKLTVSVDIQFSWFCTWIICSSKRKFLSLFVFYTSYTCFCLNIELIKCCNLFYIYIFNVSMIYFPSS